MKFLAMKLRLQGMDSLKMVNDMESVSMVWHHHVFWCGNSLVMADHIAYDEAQTKIGPCVMCGMVIFHGLYHMWNACYKQDFKVLVSTLPQSQEHISNPKRVGPFQYDDDNKIMLLIFIMVTIIIDLINNKDNDDNHDDNDNSNDNGNDNNNDDGDDWSNLCEHPILCKHTAEC